LKDNRFRNLKKQSGTLTQKSMSRFPLPPNSLSPTWNVTVMRSSLCRVSWKHSWECARIWILWARHCGRRRQRARQSAVSKLKLRDAIVVVVVVFKKVAEHVLVTRWRFSGVHSAGRLCLFCLF